METTTYSMKSTIKLIGDKTYGIDEIQTLNLKETKPNTTNTFEEFLAEAQEGNNNYYLLEGNNFMQLALEYLIKNNYAIRQTNLPRVKTFSSKIWGASGIIELKIWVNCTTKIKIISLGDVIKTLDLNTLKKQYESSDELLILKNVINELFISFGKVPTSLSGVVMSEARETIGEDIFKKLYPRLTSKDKIEYKYLLKTRQTPIQYLNPDYKLKLKQGNFTSYDLNSAYSAIMKNEILCFGKPIIGCIPYDSHPLKIYQITNFVIKGVKKGKIDFYKQDDPSKKDFSQKENTFPKFVSTLVVTDREYKLFKETYNIEKTSKTYDDIILQYKGIRGVWDEYIDNNFHIKSTTTSPIVRHITKMKLNIPWGAFCKRPFPELIKLEKFSEEAEILRKEAEKCAYDKKEIFLKQAQELEDKEQLRMITYNYKTFKKKPTADISHNWYDFQSEEEVITQIDENIRKLTYIKKEKDPQELDKKAVEYFALGVFIQSYAKVKLLEETYKEIDNGNTLIQMDTDCSTWKQPAKTLKIGNQLGEYKVENEFTEVFYFAVKQYWTDGGKSVYAGWRTTTETKPTKEFIYNMVLNEDNLKHINVMKDATIVGIKNKQGIILNQVQDYSFVFADKEIKTNNYI